ncbi:gp53-like domain-containing protein [Burkholderia gladioli]|uniref:gp53-like domain-containing protein n=1 Tax=Burkholderia gladioli TaxID=28095 RepID=UPI0034DAD814
MTTFTFANNVNTTLAGAITSTATSLTLSSAAHLPTSIPAGQALVITLNDLATRQQFEVIYATAISGATLSGLLRGQEGTAAQAWSTNDYAWSGPTSGQMAALGQLGANNTWSGSNTFSSPVTVAPAIANGHAVNLGQFASSLTRDGYKKYPDANSPSGYFIEQWGFNGIGNGSLTTNVVFPITFPNAILGMWCGEAASEGTWGAGNVTCYAPETPNTSGATVIGLIFVSGAWSPTLPGGGTRGFFWRAIGY